MVYKLAAEAFDNGHNFITRARLDADSDSPFNRERLVSDFVDLTTGEIVEVAVSEGKKSLERKRRIFKKYGLNMVVLS